MIYTYIYDVSGAPKPCKLGGSVVKPRVYARHSEKPRVWPRAVWGKNLCFSTNPPNPTYLCAAKRVPAPHISCFDQMSISKKMQSQYEKFGSVIWGTSNPSLNHWWVWTPWNWLRAKHGVCFCLCLGLWMSKTSWPQRSAAVIVAIHHILINHSIRVHRLRSGETMWNIRLEKQRNWLKSAGMFCTLRIVRVWVTMVGVNSNIAKYHFLRGTSRDQPGYMFLGVP